MNRQDRNWVRQFGMLPMVMNMWRVHESDLSLSNIAARPAYPPFQLHQHPLASYRFARVNRTSRRHRFESLVKGHGFHFVLVLPGRTRESRGGLTASSALMWLLAMPSGSRMRCRTGTPGS